MPLNKETNQPILDKDVYYNWYETCSNPKIRYGPVGGGCRVH